MGLVLAVVAGRLIESQLFEVHKGHNPLALAGAALLLALFALVAGLVPPGVQRALVPCLRCGWSRQVSGFRFDGCRTTHPCSF